MALSATLASVACTRQRTAAPWLSDAGADASASGSPPAPPSRTAAAPSASGPTTTGRNLEANCTAICEHSRSCAHPAECMPNCLAMASATPCPGEFGLFYDCLLRQPAANWECAEDGVAAIRDGYCDKEQQAALACMNAKLGH